MKTLNAARRISGRVLQGLTAAGLLIAFLCVSAQQVQADRQADAAVMPLIKAKSPQNQEQAVNTPVGRFFHKTGHLNNDADRILTRIVRERLVENMGNRVIKQQRVREALDADGFDSGDATLLEAALELGEKIDADYVLAGFVWRFRQRIGGAYGVDQPASVAFSLYLVEGKDKEVVWAGSFAETQQSLTENLLRAPEFFRRGAKWLTAEELAESGVKETLKNFPLYPSSEHDELQGFSR